MTATLLYCSALIITALALTRREFKKLAYVKR
jgi:hypothetical protein